MEEALSSLQRWRDNIFVIKQLVQNDISSTKIRQFRQSEMSIKFLVPEAVVRYIEEHNLYYETGNPDLKAIAAANLASTPTPTPTGSAPTSDPTSPIPTPKACTPPSSGP